jgi:hypothetical protein
MGEPAGVCSILDDFESALSPEDLILITEESLRRSESLIRRPQERSACKRDDSNFQLHTSLDITTKAAFSPREAGATSLSVSSLALSIH